MFKFKNYLKIIVHICFFIIIFNNVEAKKIDKFYNDDYVSDYFSGIISLRDNDYANSYKYLKNLKGLEEKHYVYSQQYILALVNLNRFKEAISFAKKIEKKNISNFEANLILGIDHLKNKNFIKASNYFLKLNNTPNLPAFQKLITESLLLWSTLPNKKEKNFKQLTDTISARFENIKKIQNVFISCYYDSKSINNDFKNLTNTPNLDLSRYYYFHANYLLSKEKVKEANEVLDSALKNYPQNLLLNQLKEDLNFKNILNFKNNFSCKNESHVGAEILYIISNALSQQDAFQSSSFYLNLAKYLNSDFVSYDILYAENLYKIKNYSQARKIYKQIKSNGKIYSWYSSKQIAYILLKEKKDEDAIKYLGKMFFDFDSPDVNKFHDYADFLKNNEKFEESINIYSEGIKLVNKKHALYPKLTEGRGVSYERLGEWEKAEKDLISSLDAAPNQAYVINYLAYTWVDKGINIKKSLEMLEKANNLKKNDPYIIDSLGWALFKIKRYKEAKKYLQMAVKLMPSDPTVNDHYGDSLWMNNKKIEARYYWNYVLNLKDVDKKIINNIKKKIISGIEANI